MTNSTATPPIPPCVVGLDGTRTGWIAVIWQGPGTSPTLHRLSHLADAAAALPVMTAVIAADIPLGLLTAAVSGGRACDQEARRFVGPRYRSVFSPPVWAALTCTTHAEASRMNRASGGAGAPGLSLQAFCIIPKIAEANAALAASAWLQMRVIEVHPEVSFRRLAGQPMAHDKKSAAGRSVRIAWLAEAGLEFPHGLFQQARRLGAQCDDLLDAAAAAWTAWRKSQGQAECFQGDGAGPAWSMNIWS